MALRDRSQGSAGFSRGTGGFARNCLQRDSCFVSEQTTGLVGLAVCESPHEVRAAAFLTARGRPERCDLVGKTRGMWTFKPEITAQPESCLETEQCPLR